MNKRESKRNCGRLAEVNELVPAQEVLEDHGEIFSCGGVYLGLNRQSPAMANHFDFLHLANHQKETLVLNNQQIYRSPGELDHLGALAPQEAPSPESAIRRLFKESLN